MPGALPEDEPIDISSRPFLIGLGADDPAPEPAPPASPSGGLAGLYAAATGLIDDVPGPPPVPVDEAPAAAPSAPVPAASGGPTTVTAVAASADMLSAATIRRPAPAPVPGAPGAPAAPTTRAEARAAAAATNSLLTDDLDWDLVAEHVQALDLQGGIGRSRDAFDVAVAGPSPETEEERTAWDQIGDLVDRYVNQLVMQRGELFAWSAAKRAAHVQAVFDEAFRYGRLAPLLREELESFNVYGAEKVVVTRADGSKDELPPIARSDADLEKLVQRVVNDRGRAFAVPHGKIRIDIGGARFTALGGPSIVEHPFIAVRKHNHVDVDMPQLVALGTLTPRMAAFLTASMRSYLSHLVSGWAYTGKTTFLRALTSALPVDEPIVTIETERELYLHKLTHRHAEVVPLQYLPDANAGDDRNAAFTLEEAIEYANRANAQTFLFGEILGDREAAAAIKALQGGKGASSTIHAKSAYKAIQRLANLLTSAAGLSDDLVPQREIMETLNLIVQLEVITGADGRRRRIVREIAEVVPGDASGGRPQLPIAKTLYYWDDVQQRHAAKEQPSADIQRELLQGGGLSPDFFEGWSA